MGQRVQSVERALKLLIAISKNNNALSVPQMAKKAGVNRATAWRLLNTLEHFDLIKKNDASGNYSISFGLWDLAKNADFNNLINKARPILERIVKQAGGTAFLEISTNNKLLVLDEFKSKNPIQIDLAGIDVPLYCGSVGKLYLSSLDNHELNEYLNQKLESFTNFTITNKKILLKEITNARKENIAFNYKEHNEQWCGITSAVLNQNSKHVAYLNLTLPTFTTTEKKLHSLKDIMLNAARELQNKLF